MGAQLTDKIYAERQGIGGTLTVAEIIALASGGSPTVKGTANIVFNNQKESSVVVLDTTINATSIVTVGIEINSDEILIENFETRVTKQNGIGFTVYCNPKTGHYKGTVTINYIIS